MNDDIQSRLGRVEGRMESLMSDINDLKVITSKNAEQITTLVTNFQYTQSLKTKTFTWETVLVNAVFSIVASLIVAFIAITH